MTATSNGLNTNVISVLLCLGIVFIAGWYFQSSLVGLRIQMIEDIAQQRIKIEVQAEIIPTTQANSQGTKQTA